ncbi:MAG: response regulator [Candidatus Nitronauta litoralis]|uniref:Response regulator n=1 Tax=Candidatus Nitronauta litoralis TaxID=2705533 RepID=A0A7T0FZZ5_9BACT|nr:MAG: response regulator [Candidatus Nitronauta litoralis]
MTSRILVADDSPTIQKIVALAFENEDMEVKGAANGQEAWGMLDQFNPDIVMADVELPGITGFELSRKIKSSADHQKRWVILLSSDFEEFDEKAFEACAAEDHLSKPFKSEDIVSKVQQMLSGEGIPNTLDVVEEESNTSANESAPLNLSAEDMEGYQEPVALSADDMESQAEEEAIGLSPDDLIDELLEETPERKEPETETETVPEPEPEPEPVIELSAEDIATENEEPIVEPVALSEEDLSEPEETDTPPSETVEDVVEEETESVYSYRLTDDQMTDFDESRMPPDTVPTSNPEPEAVEPMATETEDPDPAESPPEEQEAGDTTSPEFILGEPRRDPDPVEDLEQAFQSVSEVNRESIQQTPSPVAETASTDATPDLIRESQAFLAEQMGTEPAAKTTKKSPPVPPGFGEEQMTEAMVQHAARVLEAGLDRNLKKELSGISEQVNKVVRDVVQEMAPDIIREVIRQEIQEIRKTHQT